MASGGGSGVATAASGGTPTYVGVQSGSAARAGYDALRGPGFDTSGGPGYDARRGPSYDGQRGPGYDMQRGPNYDLQRGATYDAQKGATYDAQRPGYDAQRGPGYDTSRGAAGPHGHVAPANNVPYGSATPPTRGATAYEAPPRGGNAARR